MSTSRGRVPIDSDMPPGGADVPGRVDVGCAVPGSAETQQCPAVPHPGGGNSLGRHSTRLQDPGGDVGSVAGGGNLATRLHGIERLPEGVGDELERGPETRTSMRQPGFAESAGSASESHDLEQKVW